MIPIKLREQILGDLENDVTGLWFLNAMASDYRETNDKDAFRLFVLNVISSLLSEGAMKAGFETSGGGFKAWKGSTSEVVKRIESDWVKLGRDPNLGEIVSFCRPEAVTEFED
ncbi:MAG: hypothetical protein ACKOX6_11150 [Bdellovibrio sp.]